MQSTPYEVKRLEYQLRIDAANHCPGTYPDESEAVGSENRGEPIAAKPLLLQRIAYAITSPLRRRAQAGAN